MINKINQNLSIIDRTARQFTEDVLITEIETTEDDYKQVPILIQQELHKYHSPQQQAYYLEQIISHLPKGLRQHQEHCTYRGENKCIIEQHYEWVFMWLDESLARISSMRPKGYPNKIPNPKNETTAEISLYGKPNQLWQIVAVIISGIALIMGLITFYLKFLR